MTRQPPKYDSLPPRRGFLFGQGALKTGTAVAGGLSVSRMAHGAGTDETIKIALIGCGNRGAGAAVQAMAADKGVKLWAMADAFADRLASSLAVLQQPKDGPKTDGRVDVPPERQFIGLDAYRKAIDSGVDVVLIAGPPGYRPLHFEYAVQAGKHVFMEKPLAADAHGVRRILAANEVAKKKGLKIGVGLQRHHDPVYVDLVKRLQDGAIGEILYYRAFWNTAQPAKQPFPHAGLSQLEYQVRNWYFFHWLSGDHIVEQHIHNLDVCNWIQGAVPVSAHGQGGREVRRGKEYGNIFDHHFVEYTYANGATMISQCRQIIGCTNLIAEMAHGSRGWSDVSLGRLQPYGGEELRLRKRGRSRANGDPTNPYQAEHNELFAAIRAGQDYNEAQQGAEATLTAILGRMATYSGKVVTWQQALDCPAQLTTDAEDWQAAAPVAANADGFYPVAVPGVSQPV